MEDDDFEEDEANAPDTDDEVPDEVPDEAPEVASEEAK
jgi:hypothetical protein